MSEEKKDGGPFHKYLDIPGISKREWFAGMALQGILASTDPHSVTWLEPEIVAKKCFQYADAMLKEGEK